MVLTDLSPALPLELPAAIAAATALVYPMGLYNRIALTIDIMHEWESIPRSNTIRKSDMTWRTDYIDSKQRMKAEIRSGLARAQRST